jgi:hypothetical protein
MLLFAGTDEFAWTNPTVMTNANTTEPIVPLRIMLHLPDDRFFVLSSLDCGEADSQNN